MSTYRLLANNYILPTPAGTYYAVANNTDDKARWFLLSLLGQQESQPLTEEYLIDISRAKSAQEAMELLYRVQGLGWVQGEDEARQAPSGILEEALPAILAKLSSSRNVLLVDSQGLMLSSHGFSYELGEELSALSADLASLYQRHERFLKGNLSINSSAWGLVNSNGDSQLGVWPVFIGQYQFNLVMTGVPQFNQPAFVDLVWILSKRYLERPSFEADSLPAGSL